MNTNQSTPPILIAFVASLIRLGQEAQRAGHIERPRRVSLKWTSK